MTGEIFFKKIIAYFSESRKGIERFRTAKKTGIRIFRTPAKFCACKGRRFSDGKGAVFGFDEDLKHFLDAGLGVDIDEDMLASMTDEEIEEYFNKLYGDGTDGVDGENTDEAGTDSAMAE